MDLDAAGTTAWIRYTCLEHFPIGEEAYIIFDPNNSATVIVGMCSGGLTISNFMA